MKRAPTASRIRAGDGVFSPEIAAVYGQYMALSSLNKQGGGLGGKLLFLPGLGDENAVVAIAGNIAGAATLAVEPVAERARAAMQNGICDFSVNSLDESLRILKNEIRKKQPVSVCLAAEIDTATAEMAERGIQPDIVLTQSSKIQSSETQSNVTQNSETFLSRGAIRLPALLIEGFAVRWSVPERLARSLQSIDQMAADSLDEQDNTTAARRRWLRLAPRYLGRTRRGERFVHLEDAEWARFLVLLGGAASELPPELSVERDAS